MKVKSLDSLLNGDTKLKTIRVLKCNREYEKIKGHPFFNEFKSVYGYYIYRIQSVNDMGNTFSAYVKSLTAIHHKTSNYNSLQWKSANFFLYFINIIDKYNEYLIENKITPEHRMSCASFFYPYSLRGKIFNPDAINNKLFNDSSLYDSYYLSKVTHFYRLVEYYHSYISAYLPKGETLYHPMPEEVGFNIAHGIETRYIDAKQLIEERKLYYGES